MATKAIRTQVIHSNSRRGTTRCNAFRGMATNHEAKKNKPAKPAIQRNESQPSETRTAQATNRFTLGEFMASNLSCLPSCAEPTPARVNERTQHDVHADSNNGDDRCNNVSLRWWRQRAAAPRTIKPRPLLRECNDPCGPTKRQPAECNADKWTEELFCYRDEFRSFHGV